MSLPIYAYSFLWPMSDVGQLVVFFITNMWTFLLRKSAVSPVLLETSVHMLIFIPVVQMTTVTSSTLCTTKASSSTLGSFRTCGTD